MVDDYNVETVRDRYARLGYHVKIQRFKSVEQAEDYLFTGFFNAQTTKNDIKRRYAEFAANQVKHYGSDTLKYQYIKMPYSIYGESAEGNVKEKADIISAIMEIINRKGSRLVIVEAAAGFGKTCTAYEIYNSFVDRNDNKKPIFTELARNRDAKQFKYVLWSEIDREKDTTAKQELVIYNIKKGKIPLIIDGFDELLSKNIDAGRAEQLNEFEQVETMLSTIGDLLTGDAKIVLTSRKTAIFAGAEFGEWVDSYNGKFDVFRIQLEKPSIRQWLSHERYEEITKNNIPLESISNPVLLTYLRNIDQDEFSTLLTSPKTITDKYFEFLLNREKERQNLTIRWEDQMQIFENLAKAFIEFDITGDNRGFVKDLIIDRNKDKLLYYRESMAMGQTLDTLADTLTNHALLDRVGNKDYITFINEFVFGYLVGKSIQKGSTNFLSGLTFLPEYLLELSISAYSFSSPKDKSELWNKFSPVRDRMSLSLKLTADSVLLRKIKGEYEHEVVHSFHFEDLNISKESCNFIGTSFVGCVFEKCSFDQNVFHNVTFIGCKFKNCKVSDRIIPSEPLDIHCYGCEDYGDGFITSLMSLPVTTSKKSEDLNLEMEILGKYFKVDGRTPKMRYITMLKKEFEEWDLDAVFSTFYALKKKGLILIDGNNSHISREGISYYHNNI